ncbi:MAG: hypothetical protein M3Q07_23260, partial [Pseudobdellovibrionaceae bacterium]|nr:hypothetical protein [Pseudobdellovibrionaceae bacterium]
CIRRRIDRIHAPLGSIISKDNYALNFPVSPLPNFFYLQYFALTKSKAGETERLLIADGLNPIVRVFDVAEGAVISNFPVAGPATVYTGGSGRFAYAVQGAAN